MFGGGPLDFDDDVDTGRPRGNSAGYRSHRGTVALKTLRRPKVKTLRQALTVVSTFSFFSLALTINVSSCKNYVRLWYPLFSFTTDDDQILLAEDAGLEELLELHKHQHAKIKSLASQALSALTTNGAYFSFFLAVNISHLFLFLANRGRRGRDQF